MYRFYAESFYILTSALAISLIFDLNEKGGFLKNVDLLIFVLLLFLFISFPITLIIKKLTQTKKLVFSYKGKLKKTLTAIKKSKFRSSLNSTLSLLIIISVSLLLFLSFFNFMANFLAYPFINKIFKETVKESVITTMALTEKENENPNGEQVEAINTKIKKINDYLKSKEYAEFIDRGAETTTLYSFYSPYQNETFNIRLELSYYPCGELGEAKYFIYQESENNAYIDGFIVHTYDQPNLTFENISVDDPVEKDILVIWWSSLGDYRYIVLVPSKSKEPDYFGLKCAFGCEKVAASEVIPNNENEKFKEELKEYLGSLVI